MAKTILLQDPGIRTALRALALQAPNGYDSLDTLGDEMLMFILSHSDETKVVWASQLLLELPEVDERGYSVYDKTYTFVHRVVIDPENPTDDLSVPGRTRKMRFGTSLLDAAYVMGLEHGDYFFIGYTCGVKPPRTILCLVLDPAVPAQF